MKIEVMKISCDLQQVLIVQFLSIARSMDGQEVREWMINLGTTLVIGENGFGCYWPFCQAEEKMFKVVSWLKWKLSVLAPLSK